MVAAHWPIRARDFLLLCYNPCWKILATKCLQWTIVLYQYKLFNLLPFSVIKFCHVNMFITLDNMCDRNQGFFFFLATCATSFRIMTLYFTMCVNKFSAKDSVYLVFAWSYNALRFSLHMAESVVREIQKTKRSVIVFFFYILLVTSLRSQFSLVYLCIQFAFSAAALHKRVYIPSLHFFCENNPEPWPVFFSSIGRWRALFFNDHGMLYVWK